MSKTVANNQSAWRHKLFEVIFEADTPAGKCFDVVLIISITLSVVAVMLDSIKSVRLEYGAVLAAVEWFFTILFTVEYVLRLVSAMRPGRYALSFFGVVDLFAILPTYFSLLVPGTHFLLVIRVLRVLRVFRVLKLVKYLDEAMLLVRALRTSSRKIMVFLFTVISLVIIFGSLMYIIETEANGFTSIPRSIYWAIVTLTTVGYGDLSPATNLGQALAAVIMILGYSIIAVPTGIVTTEMARAAVKRQVTTQVCPFCLAEGHDQDALHCKYCGARLEQLESVAGH